MEETIVLVEVVAVVDTVVGVETVAGVETDTSFMAALDLVTYSMAIPSDFYPKWL